MRKRIDLGDYRDPPTAKVFSGRARGAAVRGAVQLVALERNGAEIEIHVPVDTFAVTSSFFGGMFGESIRALGEEKFRARYVFTGKDISRVVEDAIREVLKTTSPLRRAVG